MAWHAFRRLLASQYPTNWATSGSRRPSLRRYAARTTLIHRRTPSGVGHPNVLIRRSRVVREYPRPRATASTRDSRVARENALRIRAAWFEWALLQPEVSQ